MFKKTVLATALSVVLAAPHVVLAATAADNAALTQIRAGRIIAAVLALQGRWRVVGDIDATLPRAVRAELAVA